MQIKHIAAAAAVALSLTACSSRPVIVQAPPAAPDTVVVAVPVEVPAPAAPMPEMPMPAAMSIHDRVHDALMAGMGSRANGIEVRADGGSVWLSGHVATKADHNRAHQIAHDVAGVTNVNHDGLKVP